MTHFKERKPVYAILDEERGTLCTYAYPLTVNPTALFRTRKAAREARDEHFGDGRVVKVEVKYERIL